MYMYVCMIMSGLLTIVECMHAINELFCLLNISYDKVHLLGFTRHIQI